MIDKKSHILQLLGIFSILFSLLFLLTLLIDIAIDGLQHLSWKFITSPPSRNPEEAGILPALVGSFYVVTLASVFVVPIGVLSGIFMEEYMKKNDLIGRILELNIFNLSGVPSIIYGILGLQLFVRFLKLDRSIISGALTLTLLVLPIVVSATRESVRRIPFHIKEACYSLGASKRQIVFTIVLPYSLPGILTGTILAVSRALGETAPLITIGALTYITFLPFSLKSPFTVLPIQVFNWVSRPQKAFHSLAAGAILVLLILLISLNSLAIWIRNKFEIRFPE